MRCLSWFLAVAVAICMVGVVAIGSVEASSSSHDQKHGNIVTSIVMPGEMEHQAMFAEFAKQHKKVYQNDEIFHRYQQFKANYAKVMKHNAQAAQGHHTYTLGMNRYADMNVEEFRQIMARGLKKERDQDGAIPYQPRHAHDVPPSIDWRKKNAVTPVKDQGSCGSCWAFAAVGAMEGAHALQTGKLVSFSEQQLVDCVQDGTYTCDTGGEFQSAFTYAAQSGVQTSASYPYTDTSGDGCHANAAKCIAHFTGYGNVTEGDEIAMKSAVSERPVAVAIDAGTSNFQLYASGVYQDDECANQYDQLNHAVLVVGYGHDATGGDYWIVKNSWGGSWGLGGYVWMKRGVNQCGIAADVAFPTV